MNFIKSNKYCKHITDGTHDSPKYVENGFHLVTSRYIKDNKILLENSPLISKEDFNKVNQRSKIEINDILFSMIGTVGEVAMVKNNNFAIKNMGLFRCFNKKDALFLFYYFQSKLAKEFITSSITGSTQHYLTLDSLKNFPIPEISENKQKHIVDTIGTIDNLIENIEEKTQQIKEYGNKLFSKISLENLESLIAKVSFSKGKEIGSLNYLDKQINNSVPYIRVGDLLGRSYDTFTTIKDIPLCNEEDILITFDGAPGRNNYGLKGSISSGVQKVVCKPDIKGFIYFYLNSDLCQNTIQTNAQGTTILHASKAIKELKMPIIEDNNTYQKFNHLFNYLIVLSKEKTVLQKQKQLLLHKYFG